MINFEFFEDSEYNKRFIINDGTKEVSLKVTLSALYVRRLGQTKGYIIKVEYE